MWALPDCPGWTCPARFLLGRRLTSGLAPSGPALLPSVLVPSLPASLRPVPVPYSSPPELLSCLPELLSFLPALLPSALSLLPSLPSPCRHQRRVRPRAFYPTGRHPSPAGAARAPSFPS